MTVINQLAADVLRLEIVYSNLYQAYISGNRTGMINFYMAAQQINIPHFNDTILSESRRVFDSKCCFTDIVALPIQQLTLEQLKWNVEGCLNALSKELSQRNIYKTNYIYAQSVLY
ncbi:MAG: hypothetical protein K2M86_02775, partial [Odoribacter sp.]|nr:hypothetical protein [Odoribacter sp.]